MDHSRRLGDWLSIGVTTRCGRTLFTGIWNLGAVGGVFDASCYKKKRCVSQGPENRSNKLVQRNKRTFDEVPEGGEAVGLLFPGPGAAVALPQLLPSADRVDDDSLGGSGQGLPGERGTSARRLIAHQRRWLFRRPTSQHSSIERRASRTNLVENKPSNDEPPTIAIAIL